MKNSHKKCLRTHAYKYQHTYAYRHINIQVFACCHILAYVYKFVCVCVQCFWIYQHYAAISANLLSILVDFLCFTQSEGKYLLVGKDPSSPTSIYIHINVYVCVLACMPVIFCSCALTGPHTHISTLSLFTQSDF